MKVVAIAIMLVFVPAFVFAQAGVTAECPEAECHVAPFFKGTGGFVGQFNPEAMADGEALTSVGLVVTCGNITTTASVDPAADGTVAHLFNDMNGLACHLDNGEIQIHGLMDGGWYWIHDEMNSAVANLLPKGVLGNVQTPPFNVPGGDIEMTEGPGGHATLVKDTSSGRIGILPHFLPASDLPEKCGALRSGCLLTGDYTPDIKRDTEAGVRLSVNGRTITRGAESIVVTATIGGSGALTIDSSRPVVAEFYVNGPNGTAVPDQYGQGQHANAETGKTGGRFEDSVQKQTISLPIPAVTQEAWDPCRSGHQHRDEPITVIVEIANTANTIPGLSGTDYRRATYSVACPPVATASRGAKFARRTRSPVD